MADAQPDLATRVNAAVRANYDSTKNLDGRRALGAYAVHNDRGQFVVEHFLWPADASILDIGCGDGIWTAAARRRTPDGRVVGLDYSLGMLEPLGARDPEVLRVNGDAHRLPVREHSFDAVLAMFMLYHVDVSRTLPECRRALKPGGRFVAAAPGAELLPTLGDLLQATADETAGRRIPEYWIGTMRFSAQNGHHVLAPYFDRVDVAIQDTDYEVPVAAPLVSYVASLRGPALARLGDTFDYDAFLALLERRFDERLASGPIHFTRQTAVFTAKT
jgi:ubiquinone/menaquinone biosynthesis C-methylase UbiE